MHLTNRKSGLLLLLLLLCGGSTALWSQSGNTDFVDIRPKLNSPLSRLGGGNPLDQFHAAQAGMGGLTSAYHDPFHLNLENPATLASLASTSFELGVYGRYTTLEDRSASVTTNQGNLRYLALGFPLRNPINVNLDQQDNTWNAGMAFSLAPTRLVGYDLLLEEQDDDFGTAANVLRGNGGAYRFSWSNAFRYRTFSAGINLNYNFGKITNSRLVIFDNVEEALGSELLEESSLGGFTLGYGVQYTYLFRSVNKNGELAPNGKRIILGLNGTLGSSVDTEDSRLLRRFSPGGQLVASDTLENSVEQNGEVKLPAKLTFGVAYEDLNRLYVGMQFGVNKASNYQHSARPEELMDANRLAFGIQYIPNISSYNSYWKRIRYRAGLRLEGDPRSIEGEQARRNAITFGLGLPLRLPRKQVSFIDVALEAGQFGVPDILDEKYVQLTLGFSLNDNSWFFKRKLN